MQQIFKVLLVGALALSGLHAGGGLGLSLGLGYSTGAKLDDKIAMQQPLIKDLKSGAPALDLGLNAFFGLDRLTVGVGVDASFTHKKEKKVVEFTLSDTSVNMYPFVKFAVTDKFKIGAFAGYAIYDKTISAKIVGKDFDASLSYDGMSYGTMLDFDINENFFVGLKVNQARVTPKTAVLPNKRVDLAPLKLDSVLVTSAFINAGINFNLF